MQHQKWMNLLTEIVFQYRYVNHYISTQLNTCVLAANSLWFLH